jgi:ElaB/YqjD/DUF883 family membrane-anchored ribosome-binding protein
MSKTITCKKLQKVIDDTKKVLTNTKERRKSPVKKLKEEAEHDVPRLEKLLVELQKKHSAGCGNSMGIRRNSARRSRRRSRRSPRRSPRRSR